MSNLAIISQKWEDLAVKWNKMVEEKHVLIGDLSEADRVYQFVKLANKTGSYLSLVKDMTRTLNLKGEK